jgi:carbon storage regulator
MLVVSRKQDESIIIGNEIEVIVVRIDRHNVRLGVRAPRSISVHRKEVYEEIKAENLAAVGSQTIEISTIQKLLGDKLGPQESPAKTESEKPAED